MWYYHATQVTDDSLRSPGAPGEQTYTYLAGWLGASKDQQNIAAESVGRQMVVLPCTVYCSCTAVSDATGSNSWRHPVAAAAADRQAAYITYAVRAHSDDASTTMAGLQSVVALRDVANEYFSESESCGCVVADARGWDDVIDMTSLMTSSMTQHGRFRLLFFDSETVLTDSICLTCWRNCPRWYVAQTSAASLDEWVILHWNYNHMQHVNCILSIKGFRWRVIFVRLFVSQATRQNDHIWANREKKHYYSPVPATI